MRLIGRKFKYRSAVFRVIASAQNVSYLVFGDKMWCELLSGKYRKFSIGDEVTITVGDIVKGFKSE